MATTTLTPKMLSQISPERRCETHSGPVHPRWASDGFEEVLTSVGFASPKTVEITILELHVTEPPL
jgi:hypothetical protein